MTVLASTAEPSSLEDPCTKLSRLQRRIIELLKTQPLGTWVSFGRITADEQIRYGPWDQPFLLAIIDLRKRGIIRTARPALNGKRYPSHGFPLRHVSLKPEFVLDLLDRADCLSAHIAEEIKALEAGLGDIAPSDPS